jgi:glyoxylase-like metal-dependent hydrolase (beta-lactamase superfamily II)
VTLTMGVTHSVARRQKRVTPFAPANHVSNPPDHRTPRDGDVAGVEAIYAQVRAAVGPLPDGAAAGPPVVTEAAPHIRAIALRTPTLPPATHTTCYLVGPGTGEGPLLVVDPATPYPDQQAALLAVLADEAAAGRPALAVFLTHHHRDHVGAAMAVAAARGVPIWAHAETAARLPDVTIARTIGADEELVLGLARVRAVFTPGHAAGHLCLFDASSGAMIAGDMVAGLGTILVDPSEGDMAQYLASLAAMLALAPRRLLPAHGPLITDAPGKLREYIAHRLMREAKVLAAVTAAGPAAPSRLVEVAYDDTPRVLWPLAERSLVSHLVKLAREGRVIDEGGVWRPA